MSVIGALLGLVLLLFEIALIARLVLHWVGVLAPAGGGWSIRARSLTHASVVVGL
jgi:YggT family protein